LQQPDTSSVSLRKKINSECRVARALPPGNQTLRTPGRLASETDVVARLQTW
jgi:hypothetical protein